MRSLPFSDGCLNPRPLPPLPVLLDRYVALDDLWYFREGFKQAFISSTIGGSTQPARSMVYLRLLAEFANRPSPFCPDEHVARGKSCVILGRNFIERIALCINNGLVTVATQFADFAAQLAEVNAAYPVLQAWPGWKPAKDFVAPVTPGAESAFAQRQALDALAQAQSAVFALCSALNEDVSIQIHDTLFTPREFVRERLALTLREFLFKRATLSDGVIERPVHLERRINDFCSVFILVENYLDINLSSVFREVALLQTYHPSMSELGALSAAMQAPNEWEAVMVKPLVLFYSNFVTQHLMGDRVSVVWSPNRKAFVSRTGSVFRAEDYASLKELKALCRLLGPYGVKLLDQEVLKAVQGVVRKLKESLLENRAACVEMQRVFQERDADAVSSLRKFTNLDTTVALLTNVGLGLHFRELLHEALGSVMKEQVPFLHSAVECAFLQYTTNTFIVEELLSCDLLAFECGIPVQTADQGLKLTLKEAIGTSPDDVAVWSLLPTISAATFLSKSWQEADYRTAVAGYRTNLHCISKALISLVVSFKALTTQSCNDAEIAQLLELFVEQSSILLLRAWQLDPKVLQKTLSVQTTNLVDATIFLDMFVEQAPYLERESLERVLPYALLRSYYNQVFQVCGVWWLRGLSGLTPCALAGQGGGCQERHHERQQEDQGGRRRHLNCRCCGPGAKNSKF